MKTNGNQPAFATPKAFGEGLRNAEGSKGLTKREYFAGLAMQGILARHAFHDEDEQAQYEAAAAVAIKMTDALLTELEKQNK